MLVVLAPVVAELALGSTPAHLAYLLLLWLPVYGGGVLLIRELVPRVGGGWPSILLLGVAYELAEDGIGLQALTSPHLYHAADWAPRLLGFNTAYWEANVVYHAVFSVAIPILLADLLFPAWRGRPYLGKPGLVMAGVVTALGVGILRVTVPPSQDAGYVAPVAVLLGCTIAIAALAAIALAVVPRLQARRRAVNDAAPPSPALVGLTGGLGTLLFLALLFPFWGARQPAFTHGDWVLLPMAAAAVLVGLLGLLIQRWSRGHGWGDAQMLALAGGALISHTISGIIGVAHTTFDRAGLLLILVLTLAFLALLAQRVRARAAA